MHFSPEPFQQAAIDRMLGMDYQLLALRMGGGKTAITLTVINELMFNRFEISKVLVVCPKRVAELVWHTEAAKWDHTKHLRVIRVLGSQYERIKALALAGEVYVINRENFVWLVNLYRNSKAPWPFDCVVIDENRGFKDRTSESWKHVNKIRSMVSRMYLLTGTPAPNTLLELWPQISMLDRGQRLGKTLGGYREKYFLPDKRNGNVIYTWRLRQGADKLIYKRVADVMFHVESEHELPERTDNVIKVSFDMKRYNEIEATYITGSVVAVNAAVLAGKLAQMANGAVYDDQENVVSIHEAKLDALGEVLDQGEPVLCFTTYVHDQQRIMKRFPEAVKFDGERSMKLWAQGKIKLLLMHPDSGGHGVDGLQEHGNVIVWFGLPFSLDKYEQASARLHRKGQKKPVTVHHIVAVNTIDERIMQVLATKGDMQQALLDAVKHLREKA